MVAGDSIRSAGRLQQRLLSEAQHHCTHSLRTGAGGWFALSHQSTRKHKVLGYGAGEDASRNCHRNMGLRHIGSCPPPSVATDTCGSQRSLIARCDRNAQGNHYCRQQHLLATRHTPASHTAWYQHHQARRRPYGESLQVRQKARDLRHTAEAQRSASQTSKPKTKGLDSIRIQPLVYIGSLRRAK